MNTINKKIIAKEILYFFSAIVMILIFWVFIKVQNNYYENKVVFYNKQITELQIQIKELVNKPLLQKDKLKKLNENAKIMSDAGSSEYEVLAMKDAFIKRFGNKYTLTEKIKLDKLKKSEKLKNNELKKTYLKILNRDEVFHHSKILSFTLFVLLYPVRITFVLVKWAIKILKSPS